MLVRTMTRDDWPAVRDIYAEGIATGQATFETEPSDWEQWDGTHVREHRFVAQDGEPVLDAGSPGALPDGARGLLAAEDRFAVLGWVACSPTSSRCAYAGVLETSVYVASAARGRGVGSALMRAVITSTEVSGVWTLQSGVFAENTASIVLHERHGFRVLGTRERVGRLDGVWRDVVLLERRSTVAGV